MNEIEDFLMNESFQRWARQPDSESESFWEMWLLQHPEKAGLVYQAKQILQNLPVETDELSDEKVQAIWQQIHRTVITEAISESSETYKIRPLAMGRNIWRAAAVFAFVSLAGMLFYFFSDTFRYEKYETAFGEKKEIRLPDGSSVILNAHSQLKFMKDWENQAERKVWLEGEAFFDVSKQPAKQAKFQVLTASLTVEVLGTKFNVLHRNENSAVTLNEGKIKLDMVAENAEKNIFMQPGEMVRFSGKDQKLVRTSVKPENQSAWTKNYWVLENTTLAEVAEKIETVYGYEVKIENQKTAQEKMNGALPTKNINELLEVLSVTFNVHIKTNQNQIIIF